VDVQCLDDGEIADFFDGGASREATRRVDAHLAECAVCRRVVSEYAAATPMSRAPASIAPPSALPGAAAIARTSLADDARRAERSGALLRAAHAKSRVGTTLGGKYRIDRILGVGGMAVVYQATHRNDAVFALKILHPELSLRDDVLHRFLREGKVANSVKHPGVVRVVDDDVAEDGAAFLVMDLLHGATVERAAERSRGRLSVHAALALADQLLDVLAAAHARGIVHRDIKPANLFITRDGTLKVLDFGIARVRDVAAHGPTGRTHTGMVLGTPEFMAPEQAFSKPDEIDGQTDLWAVGATLFTLLTGEHVHAGDNAAQLVVRAATEHARPISRVEPDLPPPVTRLIDRALSFQKSDRWPTATAMREAVARASAESFGAAPRPTALAALVGGEQPPWIDPTESGDATSAEAAASGDLPARPKHRRIALRVTAAASFVVVAGVALRTILHGAPTVTEAPRVSPATSTTAVAIAESSSTAMPDDAMPAATAPASAPAVAAVASAIARPAIVASGVPRAALPVVHSPAPKSAAPQPGCDPNFTYDASGNKIFKPECFGR
jgi:serine/threonine protein kinase